MAKRRRRSTGKIDCLSEPLKETVEQMLLAGQCYREIVEFLQENEVKLSQMSVCRYAERYLATVEQLKMTQESMHMLMAEMEKYPNLDTTEAILRVASQNVFNAINAVPQDKWEDIEPAKLLSEATSLIRVVSGKRKVDAQLKSGKEAALEANQALLFDILARKYPDLYEQVAKVISEEKQIQEE